MTGLAGGQALLIADGKVTASHRARDAYIYVRQSTLLQVQVHTESLARQCDLRERAELLGGPAHQVVVVDEDLGRSGASTAGRAGFSGLAADVGLGRAGIILALEVSRLARSSADWYQLPAAAALARPSWARAAGTGPQTAFPARTRLQRSGRPGSQPPGERSNSSARSCRSSHRIWR